MLIRRGLMAALFTLSSAVAFSQENGSTTPGHEQPAATATINDLELKAIRLPLLTDVGGSIYLTNEYITANIKLKNGSVAADIPVKFNIYNNAIMVQRGNDELKLDSFESVSYDETSANGVKHFVFRQGYPDTDNQSSASVYQVLAEGPKVHLLKFLNQKVEDAPTLGDYSRRELVLTQQLYVYTPGGELKKVSTGKKAFAEALPAYAGKAEEIVKAKGLNLKNEKDLIVLIEELNKQ